MFSCIDRLSVIFVEEMKGSVPSRRTLIQLPRNELPYEKIDRLYFPISVLDVHGRGVGGDVPLKAAGVR